MLNLTSEGGKGKMMITLNSLLQVLFVIQFNEPYHLEIKHIIIIIIILLNIFTFDNTGCPAKHVPLLFIEFLDLKLVYITILLHLS